MKALETEAEKHSNILNYIRCNKLGKYLDIKISYEDEMAIIVYAYGYEEEFEEAKLITIIKKRLKSFLRNEELIKLGI